TLDRNTQTTQVFFQPTTGYVYGTGLTEAQTFAAYDATNTNRQAIGAALYADGLVSGTIIANGAGSTTSTGKAYLAANDLGNAVAGVLMASDVGLALDSLSPEVYGTSMIMASRNSLTLARALTGAIATPEGWNMQVGYDQQEATMTASPSGQNAKYDVNATYVIATKALSTTSQFSMLISQNDGNTSASGFSSKGSGQSLGVGFSSDLGATRLDLALTGGKFKNSGARNGQSFVDQNLEGSSMLARLSFSKLGAFTPYVGLNRTSAKLDAFSETGTGANLNVSAASQTSTNAEVGLGYSMKLTDTMSISLNVAYEHNLASTGNSLTANFADAASPTSFNVATYGADQNVFRGGIGFQASLGTGRSAGLSYDMHSGVDMKSAHEVKVNYTFRF
ncbi:MAG: autotransporter outer membrane beta-barrel domain-containing protein, partial [Verrucomicrobiota bacterium]